VAGFDNTLQPIDLVGTPIFEGDLVQYGKRTAYVLVTLEDTSMLIEFDRYSTRTDIIEQTWLYKPFDCIVRTGALSPIR
jgi:hypothetical protein